MEVFHKAYTELFGRAKAYGEIIKILSEAEERMNQIASQIEGVKSKKYEL